MDLSVNSILIRNKSLTFISIIKKTYLDYITEILYNNYYLTILKVAELTVRPLKKI